MGIFFFVVYLLMPSFGTDVQVEFRLTTMDACERIQRVVRREMDNLRMRYSLSACMPVDLGLGE